MKKEAIFSSLKELREKSKKRKFPQSLDLIINLKQFDIKKTENKVDIFLVLPNSIGKKLKICGLVDKEMVTQAKEVFDKVITKEQFPTLKKQELKRIAEEYDFFVAQSTLMVEIARYFGKIFGPRRKMPNPKSGCVVATTANLKSLYEKLQKTIRLTTKNELSIKCMIGKETLSDEEIADNMIAVYENIIKMLPNEKGNIDKILLKFTMSNAIEVKDE